MYGPLLFNKISLFTIPRPHVHSQHEMVIKTMISSKRIDLVFVSKPFDQTVVEFTTAFDVVGGAFALAAVAVSDEFFYAMGFIRNLDYLSSILCVLEF